jgi:hypothetical protein
LGALTPAGQDLRYAGFTVSWENCMMLRVAKLSLLLGLVAVASACVVEPREGYWDRDHSRYYHEHAWHPCTPQDNFCR